MHIAEAEALHGREIVRLNAHGEAFLRLASKILRSPPAHFIFGNTAFARHIIIACIPGDEVDGGLERVFERLDCGKGLFPVLAEKIAERIHIHPFALHGRIEISAKPWNIVITYQAGPHPCRIIIERRSAP